MNFLKGFGLPELLILLVLVILLFGVGRISKVAGELGKGIRSFKDGISGKGEGEKAETTEEKPEEKKEEKK
jgi:sec-independent protein translocase protein TatA